MQCKVNYNNGVSDRFLKRGVVFSIHLLNTNEERFRKIQKNSDIFRTVDSCRRLLAASLQVVKVNLVYKLY